jgi:thiol-disulfide isomerase/thioredoxin
MARISAGCRRWATSATLLVLLAPDASAVSGGARTDGARGSRIAERIRGQQIAATSPPLENPPVRAVASAVEMRDEDYVFGVTLAGRARAYPWWVAKNYHVVNDTISGVPVAVAFCEQCTGAAAFLRTLDGRVLSFEVVGVYNGTIIIRDRETRSLWAPFSGRALEGPLAGRRLERLPLSFTRWDTWTAWHPGGEVVWGRSSMREGHGSWYEPGKWGIVSEMGATLQAWDPRLPENALIYGLEVGGNAKSYPLSELHARGGVVNDRVAQSPVVVVARGPLDLMAFHRTVKGRDLTFRPSTGLQAVMQDDETGSDWSGDGEALGGPLVGERLEPVDGYLVEWHVWSAYNPGAELFGAPASVDSTRVPNGLAFPSLTLQGLEGAPRPVTLPGRVNLVVLWAAWCPPCKVELPQLERLARKHSADGLELAGIAIHIPNDDSEKDAVKRFVKEAGLSFPIFLVDESAYDRLESLSRSVGMSGLMLPTVFVTDSRARILSVLTGTPAENLPVALDGLVRGALANTGH